MRHTQDHVPNPRRVVAGTANRRKRGPLTDAGRERLRASALLHRPWERSTGPTTPQGRTQVRLNGKRRQTGPQSSREARAEMAVVRSMIRGIGETCRQLGER
jgi:hypothetical protein